MGSYLFLVGVVRLACVVGAIFLMYHGKDGWGWLIFLAIMADVSFTEN